MAVMDEFREEREAMKHGTPKQKLQYFWCYYKWHVIITAAVIIFAASFIYEQVTRKDTGFHGVFLNSWAIAEDSGESYMQGFADKAEIDTQTYDISIDNSMYLSLDGADENSYATVQKMAVYIAAGELDVIAADSEIFDYYAYLDYLTDLRDVLSEEQLDTFEPYLYYVDRKVIEAKDQASENMEEYTEPYPDPTKPEEMEDPIPVGISLEYATEEFTANYLFKSKPAFIGIAGNAPRIEAAVAFLEYVIGK